MAYENIDHVTCNHPDCDKSFPNHHWGSVKQGAGWFRSKDEKESFCPEHLPDWVEAWRERQRLKKPGTQSKKQSAK